MIYFEVLWRIVATFLVLLFLTRLTGKKQLSQITFFDFITAIAIGDIAAAKLSDPEAPFLPWLAGTVLWFAMTIALDRLVLSNRRIAKLVEGEPTIVIEKGQIYEQRLKQNYLRVDELLANLRAKGLFNPGDVEFAMFETDGTVSVLPRAQVRPVTPKDLKLSTSYEGIAREMIFEGRINQINLKDLGKDKAWLLKKLHEQGYDDLKQIFHASLDTQGGLYVDGYDDPIKGSRVDVRDYPSPEEKQPN